MRTPRDQESYNEDQSQMLRENCQYSSFSFLRCYIGASQLWARTSCFQLAIPPINIEIPSPANHPSTRCNWSIQCGLVRHPRSEEHVWTPVTSQSRMPSSAWKKKKNTYHIFDLITLLYPFHQYYRLLRLSRSYHQPISLHYPLPLFIHLLLHPIHIHDNIDKTTI